MYDVNYIIKLEENETVNDWVKVRDEEEATALIDELLERYGINKVYIEQIYIDCNVPFKTYPITFSKLIRDDVATGEELYEICEWEKHELEEIFNKMLWDLEAGGYDY